ncbi:MAG: cysteine hydrolase [Bdellovibrionales bacterium]|nr:cysteine hydrolase [Bdellovibrionales bacterium]
MIALVPIDIQIGFRDPYWGRRGQPRAEKGMAELFAVFRERGWPIFHVQHLSVEANSPLRPDRAGVEFMDFARPLEGEPVFRKHVNSGFIGTTLERELRAAGIAEIVPIGLTTDHCVSTTTRMAANLGFRVRLSEGAVATFDRTDFEGRTYDAETIHRTALASLHGEFAQVSAHADLLRELRSIEA